MNQLPKTMKGVQLTKHGDIDSLVFNEQIALPYLTDNDVLVKVAAAGVNNTDLNTRKGWYSKEGNNANDASWAGSALVFPRIQGADVCGYIVAVGKNVSSSRIGERVLIEPCLTEADSQRLPSPWYFGSECDGGFAQFTKVASKHAYAVKSSYTDTELASFPCSYSTAENLLHRANVQKGERVFITGASGGVGSAAVQLAKARGAYVVAVTSKEKQGEVNALGADETVTRDADWKSLYKNKPFNVVIDLVAGARWPDLLELLSTFGRYATSGAIGGHDVILDVRTLYLKDLQLIGCTVLQEGVFASLVKHIERGSIKPIVAATYPLKEIKQAQQDFELKKHTGKLVLTLD
ncbi:alcohol dehydrogenase [Alteromonas sp. KC3]|uniref:alcohol dehydrogenase family protein n=1 Tax=unclassified Alteromonas TaxID=2614992 RepID=UPI001921962A|nr:MULTISPECIES: alcohol dehydrogenase family protein [unclassified Alteromonas]BCO19392.1 alcohol dehydrogenase [Alteromonas sp. KC3]BCO23354.1 alcohol dehydrogenase [Alteromonas sp. KC14]